MQAEYTRLKEQTSQPVAEEEEGDDEEDDLPGMTHEQVDQIERNVRSGRRQAKYKARANGCTERQPRTTTVFDVALS